MATNKKLINSTPALTASKIVTPQVAKDVQSHGSGNPVEPVSSILMGGLNTTNLEFLIPKI